MRTKSLGNDLTKGGVRKQLLSFGVPFLISNFLQAMYNVTDTLVVSWFAGPNTVSGVAIGGQLTFIATMFAIGFTVGGTVLISQFFGAGKHEELSSTIGTMFSALAIIAAILTTASIIFARPLLQLVNTPEEAFSEAYRYFVICMSGTVFTFGYNAVAAILRGMGDSKNPLYFVLIAGVINTLLDLPFVGLFHWGAAGDAASTIIAQAISLIMAVVYLYRRNFVFTFKLKNIKIHPGRLKQILKIGLPSSIQNVVTTTSFLIMMMFINSFGVYASAAMGIVGKYNGFAILPAVAVSSSVSSMAAQNIGANRYDRARETMYAGITLALPICMVFFLIAFFAPEYILRVFTNDAAVIANGVEYIRYFSIDYALVAFAFSLNGLLMGAGMTTFTMVNAIMSSIVLRVPAAYLFGFVLNLGIAGIGLGAPAATAGSILLAYIFYKTGKWKEKRLTGEPLIIEDMMG